MGQAKRRGSFEERKVQALAKAASKALDEAEAVQEAQKGSSSRRVRGFMPSALVMAAAALAAGDGNAKRH